MERHDRNDGGTSGASLGAPRREWIRRRCQEFEDLWSQVRGATLVHVRRILGVGLRQRIESADVLQEVLLTASRKFLQREDDGKPMSSSDFLRWIRRIVENAVKEQARFHVAAQRRSIRREKRLTSSVEECLGAKRGSAFGEYLARREMEERVRRALQRLSPTERRVVELVHLERWKLSEAAAELKKTENSASVLLCRALQKLRTILGDGIPSPNEGRP